MNKVFSIVALMGLTALTACTTVKDVLGHDATGTHMVHSPINNKAPVTALNGVLVDTTKHMTLYTYDKDEPNKSNCGSVCLAAWPAFLAPSEQSGSPFATIRRDDGKYQWTFNGKPLYYYANDTKAGDKNGDGKMKVWHIIPTNQ